DTNDQSAFTDSVLAGLINDVVKHAKSSLQDPSSNNNSASESQKKPEHKPKSTPDIQEFELQEKFESQENLILNCQRNSTLN
ncbi:15034_t:CDS:1, partial [Cetraspora pellucida]